MRKCFQKGIILCEDLKEMFIFCEAFEGDIHFLVYFISCGFKRGAL